MSSPLDANANGGAPAPLSVAQEALWYVSLLDPKRISYNETVSIRKAGSLDLRALEWAFNEIVRRHRAWRTTFDTVDGEPVQIVHSVPSFDLRPVDLSGLTQEEAERRAAQFAAELSRVPYDLRRGPLVRPRLFRFPADEHRLYLAMHHIVFDGVSIYRVVLPELIALYEAFAAGRPSPLEDPQTTYTDYARWEQEWILESRAARRLGHWHDRLSDLPELALPFDRPRPEAARFRGGVAALTVPAELVDRLRAVGQGAGATLFQVLAASWSLLLGRYAGEEDVVFATAADLRQRPEFEAIVGYCLTPLVLRVDLGGDPPFTELVKRVRNELLDGLDRLVPFERVVRDLDSQTPGAANPVYQTMIVLEPAQVAPNPDWSLHQMESEIGNEVGTTKLDLELELDERPEGHLAGRLIYDRDLFDDATADRVAEHWSRIVAADPTETASRVAILTPAEERRQLVEWNATAAGPRSEAVPDLVRERCAAQPDAPAVFAEGQTVTYAELDARSDATALRLRAAGLTPGDVVALGEQPSIDFVVAALGAVKAGAATLMLDPDLPAERREFMLADSGASPPPATAARDTDAGELSPVAPERACSLQYTRGGKGVSICHRSAVNLATALAAAVGVSSADSVLVLPSTCVRVPVVELWLPLIAGARIVIASAEDAADGARLSRLIKSERVTFLHAAPSTWQMLLDTGLRSARSLRALSGGEPLTRELADRILDRCRLLWNAYGAVETASYATLARVEPNSPIAIGRPLANTRVYVVDAHRRPVPVGATGELLVAGDGVASGYLNRPDLGTSAFVECSPERTPAFRTGDLARWLADGSLRI